MLQMREHGTPGHRPCRLGLPLTAVRSAPDRDRAEGGVIRRIEEKAREEKKMGRPSSAPRLVLRNPPRPLLSSTTGTACCTRRDWNFSKALAFRPMQLWNRVCSPL